MRAKLYFVVARVVAKTTAIYCYYRVARAIGGRHRGHLGRAAF